MSKLAVLGHYLSGDSDATSYMQFLMNTVSELRKFKAANNIPSYHELTIHLRVNASQRLLDEVNHQDKESGLPGNMTLPELQDLIDRYVNAALAEREASCQNTTAT